MTTPAAALVHCVEANPAGRYYFINDDGSAITVSFAEMLVQAQRILGGLIRRGLEPGGHVVLHLDRAEDFVPAVWACFLGGFVVVPFARNEWSRHRVRTSQATLDHLMRVLGYPPTIVRDDQISLRIDGHEHASILDIDDLVDSMPAAIPPPPDPSSPAALILTSATTGPASLVALSVGAVAFRLWPALPDASVAEAFLSWLPFDHVMGLSLVAPNLPTKVHLSTRAFIRNPGLWIDLVTRYRITHSNMTNFGMSLIADRLAAQLYHDTSLTTLRKIGIGGEAISPRVLRRFVDGLRQFGLRQDTVILGYGLSECGPVVGGATPYIASGVDDALPFLELDRPTSGHAVRIVDEAGAIVPEGVVGAIEVTGATLADGYHGDPEGSARLFTSDGWLRTGDLGRVSRGRLTVTGRAKEIVVANARKYASGELEAVAESVPSVSAAIAIPLQGSGDEGFALAIVANSIVEDAFPVTETAVRTVLADELGLTPAFVFRIDERAVPRTATGKVVRSQLAALARDKPAPTVSSDEVPAPMTEAERVVAETMSEFLGKPVPPDQDFFSLGGDSVAALQLVFELEGRFRRLLPPDVVHENMTVIRLAHLLDPETGPETRPARPTVRTTPSTDHSNDPSRSLLDPAIERRIRQAVSTWPGQRQTPDSLIVGLNTGGQQPPIFWCMQGVREHGQLAFHAGPDQPVYAMRSGVLAMRYDDTNIVDLAERYISEIRAIDPMGPYIIAGNCQGGMIAIEIAQRLVRRQMPVRLLYLVDTVISDRFDQGPCMVPTVLTYGVHSRLNPRRLFRNPELGWKKLFAAGLRVESIPCDHNHFFSNDHSPMLVASLQTALNNPPPLSVDVPATGAMPSGAYRGRVALIAKPRKAKAGSSLSLTVRVRNRGSVTWPRTSESGIRLGNHWLGSDGEMLRWSDRRTDILEGIPPGAHARFEIEATVPYEPGEYLLEVDLVEEGVTWFKDRGSGTLIIPVTVQRKRKNKDALSIPVQ